MFEIYTFVARITARNNSRIVLSPEDRDAFLDYVERDGLSKFQYHKSGKCVITVTKAEFVAAAIGVDRVRYSVEKWGSRLRGVKLEPLG